jgi:hypothetical protein
MLCYSITIGQRRGSSALIGKVLRFLEQGEDFLGDILDDQLSFQIQLFSGDGAVALCGL